MGRGPNELEYRKLQASGPGDLASGRTCPGDYVRVLGITRDALRLLVLGRVGLWTGWLTEVRRGFDGQAQPTLVLIGPRLPGGSGLRAGRPGRWNRPGRLPGPDRHLRADGADDHRLRPRRPRVRRGEERGDQGLRRPRGTRRRRRSPTCSTEVYNYWDRGLLGMALDPQLPDAALRLRPLHATTRYPAAALPTGARPASTGEACPDAGRVGPSDGCVVERPACAADS